jgi:hypothetical protein
MKIGIMNSRIKIHLIIVAAVLFIAATIYMVSVTRKWNSYSTPVTENHIQLYLDRAEDYSIDRTVSYYYQVIADVRYSQDTWPNIKEEILKSDTLLLQHNCTGD